MSYKVHEIKLLEDYCDAVLSGEKTFEVRKNDRGYQKGDHIFFIPVDREYKQFYHPVSEKEYGITYVHSGLGLKNGYVVLGIAALSSMKGPTAEDKIISQEKKEMKKVFISQPMNGLSDLQILEERKRVVEKLYDMGYEPKEITIIDSFIEGTAPDNTNSALWCLGKSLELLADADIAVFSKGWKNARGCLIEFNCAKNTEYPIFARISCRQKVRRQQNGKCRV